MKTFLLGVLIIGAFASASALAADYITKEMSIGAWFADEETHASDLDAVAKVEMAKKLLGELQKHIETGSELTTEDERWLNLLRNQWGTESLTVPNINGTKDGTKLLADALRVMIAATNYKPEKVEIGGVYFTVHNQKIAALIKPRYTEKSLRDLTSYLDGQQVFDMSADSTRGFIIDEKSGLAQTCGASENWEMSERHWITDIMRVGDVQKIKRPETWSKALNTIGDYYNGQDAKFRDLIAYPGRYRNGGLMEGIPHIFLSGSLKPDLNWFNNKRLESHGLALKEFSQSMIDGMTKDAPYGYKSADDIPDNVIKAMNNLSKYFTAIDYSTAPSAGNWEEVPISGGLTHDSETIRSGLSAFRDLLYNPEYGNNAEIQKARKRIQENNPLDNKTLEEAIKKGEERVRKTYLAEAPGVRPYDASLAFITTSDIRLDDDPVKDVEKNVAILELLEKHLVRENGIIRYAPFNFRLKDGATQQSPDSYLTYNFFNAINKDGKLDLEWQKKLAEFGSKDTSDPEVFAARAKLATENTEAQWFMVSEMSTGYGLQIEKILKNAEDRELTEEESGLIEKCKSKQTEFLNRALARLSDEDPDNVSQIKANGMKMPAVTLTEAYQYVSDLDGRKVMIPGTNAPLAWALASLYKAVRTQQDVISLSKR